uniref:(northern house mosquito) hypothetical protein n=1 Tax=Culex pipiens TaxID=7175 RepID=A0A8D8MNI2_CULPI
MRGGLAIVVLGPGEDGPLRQPFRPASRFMNLLHAIVVLLRAAELCLECLERGQVRCSEDNHVLAHVLHGVGQRTIYDLLRRSLDCLLLLLLLFHDATTNLSEPTRL